MIIRGDSDILSSHPNAGWIAFIFICCTIWFIVCYEKTVANETKYAIIIHSANLISELYLIEAVKTSF